MDLSQLSPGDLVTVKPNLDHPAWMIEVEADPRDGGGTKRVRDESVDQVFADLVVTETSPKCIRLSNNFWYLVEDGYQEHSSATLID